MHNAKPGIPNVERLRRVLEGATMSRLRRLETIAVAASGGLDSSVLAALLSAHSDYPVQLVTVCAPGAGDADRARLLGDHLHAPLAEIVLTPARVEAILPALVPLLGARALDAARAAEWGLPEGTPLPDAVQTAWEIPVFLAAREARRFTTRLVLGQGADELLGGYRRYEGLSPEALRAGMSRDLETLDRDILPAESRIAEHLGVQFQYPYLNERVRALCRRLPVEALVGGGVRKRVLRDVARGLGLPSDIVDGPKTAAQYGSGSGAVLAALAEKAGLHQNEYLARFLAQRRMADPNSLRT